MGEEFNTETILSMDYRVLRTYTEEAVLYKPSLIGKMRGMGLASMYAAKTTVPAKLARLRCISAYIGVPDPCGKN